MEISRPKDRETWHSQSCSHVQGLPKTTLSSHPLRLPLLGLYPSLYQHLHLSLCLLSGESPSSHTPLHAAVALLKINKELLTPLVSRPASLVPTGHAALQHQSHPTCIRHQANRYFTFEADLILPITCLKLESASLVSLNCLL